MITVSTIEATHSSTSRVPVDVPIVFVIDDNVSARESLELLIETAGFLTKPFRDDALIAAIEQALERSRRTLEQQSRMRALRESYASLTRREREVMLLVVSGLLNKQVAGELGISEITVKSHRGQVMRKMKAGSLPALVNMVARLGLATASI
jgi:FixJ family two-component response regulator